MVKGDIPPHDSASVLLAWTSSKRQVTPVSVTPTASSYWGTGAVSQRSQRFQLASARKAGEAVRDVYARPCMVERLRGQGSGKHKPLANHPCVGGRDLVEAQSARPALTLDLPTLPPHTHTPAAPTHQRAHAPCNSSEYVLGAIQSPPTHPTLRSEEVLRRSARPRRVD